MTPRARPRLVPTAGFFQILAVGVSVLYAAAAQNNGAAYLLAFALFALFCVGILHGLRNLGGLSARLIGAPCGFAALDSDASTGFVDVRVAVHNESSKSRFGLNLSFANYPGSGVPNAVPVLVPGAMEETVIRVRGLPRGCYVPDAVRVSSLYPFGFLRTLRSLPLNGAELWVYPAPARGGEMPVVDSPSIGAGGGGSGGEDFVGVRTYQEGESQRHVDWKAVSRGSPRMVKQFGGGVDRALILDWDRLEGDAESRLSSLCFWLLQVENEGLRYGLKMPGREVPPGNGAAHLHSLLRLLAGYPGFAKAAAPGMKGGGR